MADDRITVRLGTPIKIDGVNTSALKVRTQITLGDLRAVRKAGGSEFEQEIAMIARLAGLLPEDLDQLAIEDYEALGKAVATAKKAPAGTATEPSS